MGATLCARRRARVWLACAAAAISAAIASGAHAQSDGEILAQYTTADTEIGVLLADPAARAIVEKHAPSIVRSGQSRTIATASLKSIQGYALPTLNDQVLAQIDAELAKLPPRPVKPSRMTVDEAKVRPYTLPDPLKLSNGQPVRDARTWRQKRRPEILRMFETVEFGRAPPRPPEQRFEVFDKGTPAFGGKALRKQVVIHLSRDPSVPTIQLVEYIPAAAKKPVPMLLMIGFTAPSAMIDDPGIRPSQVWSPTTKQKVAATPSPMGRLDIQKFLDAGFGVTTFYYGDLDPDFSGGYPLGIRAVYDKVPEAQRASDAWGSIAAWAWSASRVQDYLETDRDVDPKRVALYGASRLGKTVLWAAARDERFAAVIACCSGKSGAGLRRRNFGASLTSVDGGVSDHWQAPGFLKARENPDALPMDGHMLLGLIAPRPVLLQTGKYDHAADPKGEFLSAVAATPVYELLGKRGLRDVSWPPQEPILNDLGYWMNAGGHGPAKGDWDIYLAFLRKHLQAAP